MRVLVILPHPDDGEAMLPCTILRLVQAGHDVTMALATSDHYGTKDPAFKGRRMERIRKAEMRQAARVYGIRPDGTSKIRLAWVGFVDGHTPKTRPALERVQQLITEVRPHLIFGADPINTIDEHNDHVNIGWLTLWAVHALPPAQRPRLWLYQSYKWNKHVRIRWRDTKIAWDGFGMHKTQLHLASTKLMNIGRVLLYFGIQRLFTTWPTENFREVKWVPGEHRLTSFMNRVGRIFFKAAKYGQPERGRYLPSPHKLGLATAPVIRYERPLDDV